MYRNYEYHDSYYYHTCVVVPEKDVLMIDIVGTGCVARIMRWWHDLFLLSYASGRSRRFYNSSHAMKIERLRQFRKYRHRIHPMSKFRNFWDFLILHVFIMNKIIFILTSSFIFEALPISLFFLGAFFELIIIADLYVNLKTGYVKDEDKIVVLDTNKSLINYCTKNLFIHFASAMPLHWLMFIRYGFNIACGLCKANKFICALKIISVFSLFRVFETSTYWTKTRWSPNISHIFKFLRIGAIGFVTMGQFYDLSDAITLLVFMARGEVVSNSMLGVRSGLKYGYRERVLPNEYFMGLDINRIFKSLQLQNFDIAERIFYLDKITALIGYITSKIFFAWTLLVCYAIVSPHVYPKHKYMQLREKVLNVLSTRQISDDMNLKVEQYFDFRPVRYKTLRQTNELYRMLPKVLKKEAKLSCFLKLMMRIPYFADLPLPILEDIVLLLREEIYLRNAIVAEAWVQARGLMIVDNGVLAVYSKNRKEEGHLIDGDFFGGLSLVTDQELCMSFVVAITTCTILILDKQHFRNLMRNHTKLFLDMKMQMKNIYKTNVNDLVSSRRASELSQLSPVKYLQT